jgi:hypothetical protein
MKREADAGSTMAAFLRQTRDDDKEADGFPKGPRVIKKPPHHKPKHAHIKKIKVPKPVSTEAKESVKVRVKTALREADGAPGGGGKYKVLLIQEGLGNLRDCFYYTKECLQNSAESFEGVKCFADHPNQIEEKIHPERSTRDILGHYEDVEYTEENGRGQLQATLILCEGEHFDWARSLLTNALEYSKKYSNAEFVGFSINASGEAGSADLAEFIQSGQVPKDALAKLQKAQAEGIDEIRPVSALTDAVSVDLVTEAGAGGKILTMMERNKAPMKTKKKPAKKIEATRAKTREAYQEEEEEDGDDAAGGTPPGQQDHADAAQDVALFKKMIGQYLGDDHGADEEEAMKMAKHAFEYHKQEGKEDHEAYEAAGNHLKAAHAIGKSMCAKQEEAKQEEAEEEEESHEEARKQEEEESKKHEDSDDGDGTPPPPAAKGKKGPPMPQESKRELIKLKAEVAGLKESNRKIQVQTYLDKKLAASDRSPEFIKAFREALGKPRDIAHIEEIWGVFTKAAEIQEEEGDEATMFTENSSGRFREGDTVVSLNSFKDCVK